MRKVTAHYMLLLIALGASALATGPALAKNATVAGSIVRVETGQSAHLYRAKHWKRGYRAARV